MIFLRFELVSLNLKNLLYAFYKHIVPIFIFTILYQTSFFLQLLGVFTGVRRLDCFNCIQQYPYTTLPILHIQKPQKKLQNFKNQQKVQQSFKPKKMFSVMNPCQMISYFFFSIRHFKTSTQCFSACWIYFF